MLPSISEVKMIMMALGRNLGLQHPKAMGYVGRYNNNNVAAKESCLVYVSGERLTRHQGGTEEEEEEECQHCCFVLTSSVVFTGRELER